MSYDLDLRERVIAFVKNGGRKTDAVRVFNVGRRTVYNWLARADLAPKVRDSHDRKLKKEELAAHVQAFPDAFLRERAQHFGVRTSTVWAALQQMKIRKKNDAPR
ncbi:MAG: helix-turn-helix domain-containing protein [Magnetococcales bacterium]|nr:helix-turn-helix domain-containing protein [Magnetococcales bacterium]